MNDYFTKVEDPASIFQMSSVSFFGIRDRTMQMGHPVGNYSLNGDQFQWNIIILGKILHGRVSRRCNHM